MAVGQNFDTAAAYEQSFGHLKNGTCYQSADVKSLLTGEVKYNADLREGMNTAFSTGLKAHGTTAGGAGTAGYAMIPIYVDPMVIDTTRKNTPVVEIIPRVTNQGMFADYNKITAKGGAFTRAEDAALTETDTTYDRASTEIKFLYSVGRVTGPSIAGQPSYILMGMQPGSGAVAPFSDQGAPNAKQMEVLVKTREIRELEENLIINGNATTSSIAGNPNGTEFDGIVTLQAAVNKVDKNTSAMALGDIDTAIQYAFDDGGRPEVGICSSAVFTDLLGLLSAKIGYLQPAVTTQWGITAINLNTMVGQLPVVPSMYLSNTTGSKALYFLQLQGNTEMRVLQDLTYEELAHTNDSQKFMLKIYETLIIRNNAFNSFIGEIA